MKSVDPAGIDDELVTAEQDSTLELRETQNENNFDDSSKMWCWIGVCGGALFTIIVMAIGIVVVCLNAPKPRDGEFSILTTYPMDDSAQPMSIAVGDFNRDYRKDIAVANFGANNICILFGYDNGTFTNQTCYPLGYDSRPDWIVFEDLNNDGWKDIAVATYGIGYIKILLNLC